MAFKIAELFADLKIKDAPFNVKMARVRKNLGLTNKNISAFTGRIKKVGKQLAIFGGIAAGAFALLAKRVGDFDTTLQQTLNLLTEADQAKFGEELRKGVRRLAVESGRSLIDVTNGLFDLISAGTGAGEAIDQLRVALKLSVGSAVSAGTAIDALTTLQNSFNLSSADLATTSDLLFTINKAGKTTIEKLAASIGNVASDASGAGVTIEELGASISTLTFSGVKTEQTMTKLKALFIELGRIPFAKQVRKLGVDFKDTDLKTLGLNKTLEKLSRILPENRKFLTQNGEAISALNILLDKQTKFHSDLNAQLDRSGATNRAAEASAKTLGEQLKKLTAQLNDMFIEIGTNLIPQFTKLIPLIASTSKNFSNFLTGLLKGEGIIGRTGDLFVTSIQGFKSLFEFLKDGSLRVGEFSTSYAADMGKVIDKNIKLQKSFDKLGTEISKAQSEFRKRQVAKTRELVSLVGEVKGDDPLTIQNKLAKITTFRLKQLKKQRDFLKTGEGQFGTGGFLRTGRKTKREELAFIAEQEKKIKTAARAKLAEAEAVIAGKQLKIFTGQFTKIFQNARSNLNASADKFKEVFAKAQAGFAKVVAPIKETFKTISAFAQARTEQERLQRLEGLTPEKAEQLFQKGLEGFKQEFSPQELLNKISSTIATSSQASFVGLEQFQKNLQLSFLGVEDKKDKAVNRNTKEIVVNTKAVKELVKKIANLAGVVGGGAGGGNFMLPLGV